VVAVADGDLVWTAKNRLSKVPGVYPLYRRLRTGWGEGKVYTIRIGPLRGLKWRRRNSLPFWYHVGLWEPSVARLIRQNLKPGGVFWDVGANAGYFTVLAARCVGPSGEVVAFEPDPDTVAMLDDNVRLNAFTNVVIEQAAAAGENGTAEFARQKDNNLTSSLVGYRFSTGDTFSVKTVTLDDCMVGRRKPTLLKMDIEGGEIDALPAADTVFSGSDRPVALISVHGPEAASASRQFLEDHGYDVTAEHGMEQMLVGIPT